MDRYVVGSVPDLLQMGIAPALIFFDKLVVPDAKYVALALHEIGHPEVFRSSGDPTGEKTISEVRLGVGYHLWPDDLLEGDWTEAPQTLLRDLDYLSGEDCIASVATPSDVFWSRPNSFGAWDHLSTA